MAINIDIGKGLLEKGFDGLKDITVLEEMEYLGINPFQYMSLGLAVEKANFFYKYLMNTLSQEDEDYYMVDIIKKELLCSYRKAVDSENFIPCSEVSVLRKVGNQECYNKHLINICKKIICLLCNERSRAEDSEILTAELKELKKLGDEFIMLTVVAPLYLEDNITLQERVDKFHEATDKIFHTNSKCTLKCKYNIEGVIMSEEEFAFSIVGLTPYLHMHIYLDFETAEDKKNFQAKFEDFRKFVFKIMSKHFNIANKKSYKKDCIYVTKAEGDKEGEGDFITPKNGNYIRKSHIEGRERIAKWNDMRVTAFSISENFDKEKKVFVRISDKERELIREFYRKGIIAKGKFCLREGEMVALGGRITKEDLALKETNPELYKKIMYLKTYGVRRFYQLARCYYRPKKEGSERNSNVYPLNRFSSKIRKRVGGSVGLKEIVKEDRARKREEKERELEYSNREVTAREAGEKREEIKEIAEENLKEENNEKIIEYKERLAESAGLDRRDLDQEIIRRKTEVYKIGTELYNYVQLKLAYKNNWTVSMETVRECFFKEGMLLNLDGKVTERLYRLTEEYNLDRSQIFISPYFFGKEEYSEYFPKIRDNRELERRLITRLGITLKEYNELWYNYSISELKLKVEEIIANGGKRDKVKVILKEMNLK